MSMRNAILSLVAAVLLYACATMPGAGPSPALETAAPGIGRVPTAEEIRGWDIDVDGDGRGLPAGQGSVATGKAVYEAKCAACHGARGNGGPAPDLAGGIGTLATAKPVRTVGSFWPYAPPVFDYVRRSMPWNKPMSLSTEEVYAVTGYVLHLNGLVPENALMNAQTLPAVRMPNRNGFVTLAREPEIPGVRCMSSC
jgi:cytochrome c